MSGGLISYVDLLRKLFPSIVTSACIVFVYEIVELPRETMLLVLALIPVIVSLGAEIFTILLRSRSDTANISAILKIVEEMESRGLVSSQQRRSILYTLLDKYVSPEAKLEIEVGDSIRRHGESLRTNLRE